MLNLEDLEDQMATKKPTSPADRLASSTLLTLCSRIAVVVGTPMILGLMTWVVETTEHNTQQIAELTTKVTYQQEAQDKAISYVQQKLDSFEQYTDRVLQDHEARLRAVEHEDDHRKGR